MRKSSDPCAIDQVVDQVQHAMTTVYEFLAREIAREFVASLPSLGVMVVAMLLQAFVVPLRSARLLDDVACETEQCGADGPIASTLLRIAACQAVAVACRAAERRLSEARAQRTRCRLRTRLFARVLRLDDACADALRVGELVHALREPGAAWVVSEAVGAAVRGLVPLVGGGAAMYAADARLACVALGTAPLLFLVTKLRGRLAKAFAKTANEREAAALARAAEALANRSTVRSHGAEALEAAGFAKLVDGMLDAHGACLRRDARLGAAAELIAAAGELALLAAAARRRAAGGLTLGGYAAFRAALLQYQRGLRDATKCANKVASGLGAAERYVALSTAYASSILDGEATAPCPPGPPEVRFEDVRFAYGSAPADALAGVDLVCRAGATTALVGPSGSGKSSLGGLLLRLRDPRSGSVRVGGVDLRRLDVVAHRRRVGVVLQEPCLFDRTLRENVGYGLDPPPSLARVRAAARAAGVDGVVAAMPDGWETLAGEGATRLSGGEKQRVAIARALVREPDLLLLDEATSALDAEAEAVVLAALDAAAAGRTALVIAHRLATVRRADAIAVLVAGAVVERGDHDALVALGGVYADLVSKQGLERRGGDAPPRRPPAPRAVPGDASDDDSSFDDEGLL